jgi:hypothetical protein
LTKSRANAQTRVKWRRWHDRISNSVGLLVLDAHIFDTSMNTAARDRIVKPQNQIYQWALRVYATHAVIGIRRVLDRDKRTYPLLHLVREIEKQHSILTRRSFVSGYGANRDLGDSDFDRIAGRGAAFLPKSTVTRDRRKLERLEQRGRALANKFFAHRDRNRGRIRKRSFKEIRDFLGQIETMCIRYELILRRTEPSTLLPSVDASDTISDARRVWGRRSG